MNRIPALAAFLVLGPVSGPLYLRGQHHWRRGDRFLALLYGLLIALFWLLLPALTADCLLLLKH